MKRVELEGKTIGALRALAKVHSLRLLPKLKKKEIVELLFAALGEKTAPLTFEPPQEKDPLPPKLEAHRGEGEARDEKVFFSAPLSEIPPEYGGNYVVMLVRDPYWIHTYWEVAPREVKAANQKIGDSAGHLTLRVYNITASPYCSRFWDIEVFERNGSWNIDAGHPNHTWMIDIGVKSREGQFVMIARSNSVHTPQAGPSSNLEEEWWTIIDLAQAGISGQDEGKRFPSESIEEKVQEALESNLFSLNYYQTRSNIGR